MTKRVALRGRRVISNDRYAHENEVYQRIWRINEAIRHHDINALRTLGREAGGFVNNSLRRRVWYASSMWFTRIIKVLTRVL
jgi:hypothetical protein